MAKWINAAFIWAGLIMALIAAIDYRFSEASYCMLLAVYLRLSELFDKPEK